MKVFLKKLFRMGATPNSLKSEVTKSHVFRDEFKSGKSSTDGVRSEAPALAPPVPSDFLVRDRKAPGPSRVQGPSPLPLRDADLEAHKRNPKTSSHLWSYISLDRGDVVAGWPKGQIQDGKYLELIYIAAERNSIGVLRAIYESKPKLFDNEVVKKLLETAIESHALRVVEWCLEVFNPSNDIRRTCVDQARVLGDPAMVDRLRVDRQQPLAAIYFAPFFERVRQGKHINKLELRSALDAAYRFSSMDDVEDVVDQFEDLLDSANKKIVEVIHQEALKAFKIWGPQVARYVRTNDLKTLQERYNPKSDGRNVVQSDMQFGRENILVAEKALADLGKATPFETLLRFFAEHRRAEALARSADDVERFTQWRLGTYCETRIGSTYSTALPLVEEMYSRAYLQPSSELFLVDAKHQRVDAKSGEQIGYAIAYNLGGEDVILTTVVYQTAKFGSWSWQHGRVPLKKLMPRLKELHTQVMDFKFDEPKSKENIEKFYQIVSEMSFLMGHATPMLRGTGRLVDQWLSFVHLYHKIPVPILKRDIPQIDCFNLSVPLSVHRARFLRQFETLSLHRAAQDL